VFSRHVINVLQDEHRLVGELEALRGIRRGELKLISVEGLNADLLPNVLERMMTQYPTVKITVCSAGSAQTARAVIDGDADVAVGFALERSEALRQCAVARFCLGAIVRADHPLATLAQVGFAECARYPLILPGPELSTHAALKPLISHLKRPLTVLLESASIELARSLVLRGVGVAFQTRVGIEHALQDGRIAHVPLKAQTRLLTELGVYVRAGRTLPPVLDAFIRMLAEEIERREALEPAAV